EIDIEGFVEPPPEGFELDEASVPLPNFLKPAAVGKEKGKKTQPAQVADMALDPGELPELDPFNEADSLLDEFATELPEELGGPAKEQIAAPEISEFEESFPAKEAVPQKAENGNFANLSKARDLFNRKKWKEVVDLLSPVYASERSTETGLMLANALLETKEPVMAMEIVDTLDIDPELMNEPIKDAIYRTGIALEGLKKYDEALRMYDMICNVDINYRDAFDRSDKIYSKKKN
ncbi:MAG: hypothetical protein ACOYXC_09180, partial [Candidatus Rifleibacteriota bacterium]